MIKGYKRWRLAQQCNMLRNSRHGSSHLPYLPHLPVLSPHPVAHFHQRIWTGTSSVGCRVSPWTVASPCETLNALLAVKDRVRHHNQSNSLLQHVDRPQVVPRMHDWHMQSKGNTNMHTGSRQCFPACGLKRALSALVWPVKHLRPCNSTGRPSQMRKAIVKNMYGQPHHLVANRELKTVHPELNPVNTGVAIQLCTVSRRRLYVF